MKWALFSSILVAGCAQTSASTWSKMSQQEKLAALAAVTGECRLSKESLQLKDDMLVMQFEPTADFKSVDCALEKLKILKVDNMGFIGNEAYEPEKK